jgi:deoxyribonuclease V
MWPRTADDLVTRQERLAVEADRARADRPYSLRADALVGGCFVAFARRRQGPGEPGDAAWAAAVVTRGGLLIAEHTVVARVAASYAPGLLALREGPVLGAAVTGLDVRPDVLLVDATGRDHPRGAGLALHLGAVLDVPTVGVTHRALVARGEPSPASSDAFAPVRIGDEVVAAWVRTSSSARPVLVHSAWRTDIDTAVAVVLASAGARARTPIPLREARRLARTARARA